MGALRPENVLQWTRKVSKGCTHATHIAEPIFVTIMIRSWHVLLQCGGSWAAYLALPKQWSPWRLPWCHCMTCIVKLFRSPIELVLNNNLWPGAVSLRTLDSYTCVNCILQKAETSIPEVQLCKYGDVVKPRNTGTIRISLQHLQISFPHIFISLVELCIPINQ